MITPRNSLIFVAALLALAPLALSHGDDDDTSMGMDMSNGPPATPAATPTMTANLTSEFSYFSYPDNKAWIWAHIALMIIAWCFIAPIAVMLSIAKSRYTFPWQTLFVLLNAIGILLSFIYDAKVPNLYEHNVHYRMGWLFTWISFAWLLMGIVNTYARKTTGRRHSGQQISAANMAQYQRIQHAQEPEHPRWSRDSGQGTERNSASLFGSSGSGTPTADFENQHFGDALPPYDHDEMDEETEVEKRSFLRNTLVDRFLSSKLHKYATDRAFSINKWTYVFFERSLLILGFFAITSGFVVFGGLVRGGGIFNLLAHFIKGGIFFWYGLLTLGRWTGAFADFGWAWNVKPPRSMIGSFRAWVPSGEFTESFVIFLYGVTNVWLEHLGAWGGSWNPEDFQHVSITVLFAGGGLLGMLIESRRVRELLQTNLWQLRDKAEYVDVAAMMTSTEEERWKEPGHASVPLNPMPALVILLLGIMMSSHTQHSMVSSMIHKQWGYLFAGFSLARMATYVLVYIKPYNSYLPSRPPTEIITSFCLVSGGLLFMASTWSIVATLEKFGIGAMFVFTCMMGLTAGVMAWETFLLALKGWAERKENPVLVRRLAAQSQNWGPSASA